MAAASRRRTSPAGSRCHLGGFTTSPFSFLLSLFPLSTVTQPPFSASNLGQQVSRALGLMVLYIGILAICRYVSYEIRFDFIVPHDFQQERLMSMALNIPVKLGFLFLFRGPIKYLLLILKGRPQERH